ncbi:invasion protein IalB [Agrobacterium vitis]|uniref:Invasion associated locus B family protein n=2 Tax=Allorhizobium terrae TaxID=1848972 RepID=A0A4S3ZUQ2_9HYPH|nr:invasion associated locus B family protein [Allorhizobium terrae]TWD48949.1 invasion protein IalB [Agrobacterium vitis]
MTKRSTAVLVSLLVALAGGPLSAVAQTKAAGTQAKPVAPAETNAQPQGTTATYQDWLVRCVTAAENARTCEIVQNLQVEGRGLVATVALGKIDPKDSLRMVVQVPSGVWLPTGVTLKIDEKANPLHLEYKRCLQGCFAEIEVDAPILQALKSATQAGSFTFEDGNRRAVTLPLSFSGFTPALDASLKP